MIVLFHVKCSSQASRKTGGLGPMLLYLKDNFDVYESILRFVESSKRIHFCKGNIRIDYTKYVD